MNMRLQISVAVLQLVVTAIAAPAFAQSMPANPGPDSIDVNRDAPVERFVGIVEPMAMPQIDRSAIGRAPLEVDPESALASIGTVTVSSDGSVTSEPATEHLRDLLLEELEQSSKSKPGPSV